MGKSDQVRNSSTNNMLSYILCRLAMLLKCLRCLIIFFRLISFNWIVSLLVEVLLLLEQIKISSLFFIRCRIVQLALERQRWGLNWVSLFRRKYLKIIHHQPCTQFQFPTKFKLQQELERNVSMNILIIVT